MDADSGLPILLRGETDVPDDKHALPGVRYGGCDLCGQALVKQDVYLALVGNPNADGDSTKYHSVAGRFTAVDHQPHTYNFRIEHNLEEAGIVCSNRKPCSRCYGAPEAIYIHQRCLDLLVRESALPLESAMRLDSIPKNLLDFVWTTSAWRSPWRHALYLCLDDNLSIPVLPPVSYLSRTGLQGLAKLPLELLRLVRDESCRSPFWGYMNVMDMARRYQEATSLAADELPAVTSVSLSTVSSWKRGHAPVLIDEPCTKGMIRLTIDSAGMRSIKRLDHDTLYGFHKSTPRFDNRAFAVFDAVTYPEAKVHLKVGGTNAAIKPRLTRNSQYGLARLCLPRGARHPDIWDTPLPPNMEPMEHGEGLRHRNWRFQTADLDKVTALSFLARGECLVAIHRHTSEEPNAVSTLERMAPWVRRPDMWEYVGISHIRRHLSEMRQLPRNIQRLLFARVTVVGLLLRLPDGGALPDPSRLVWGYYMPNQDMIAVVATATSDPKGEGQDAVRHLLHGHYAGQGFANPYVSVTHYQHRAPLHNVVRAQVFNQGSGYCEGIIFDYADGSQKAVGCCRTGVTVPVTTWMPVRIHIRRDFDENPESHQSKGDAVALSSEGDSVLDQGPFATPWESFPMVGRITFDTTIRAYGRFLTETVHVMSVKVGRSHSAARSCSTLTAISIQIHFIPDRRPTIPCRSRIPTGMGT